MGNGWGFRIAAAGLLIAAWARGEDREVHVCVNPDRDWAAVYQAELLASKMFSSAGVRIVWHMLSNCPPGGDSIGVRVTHDPSPETLRDAWAYSLPFGPGRIVVYYNRVESTAGPAKAPRFLAHVLVHEITHVIERSNSHSSSGVMKARWDGEDYFEMGRGELTFTPGDIRLMHQGLDFRDARPARTAATAFSFAPQTIPPDYICRDGAESRNPPPRAIGDDGKPTPEFQAWLDGSAQPSCAGQPATSAPATVSVQTLRRKVSGKAMGEFRRGMEVFRKGDFTAAAKLFEDAARRSPVFVDARAYAGLAYVRLGQFAEAVRSYQQAVDLEPANAPLLSNLASALLQVHRPEEGELAARRALKAAPDSSEAHYMLGLALVAQEKELDEADSHLALAEEKYPRARMVRDWIRNASTASKQSAQ